MTQNPLTNRLHSCLLTFFFLVFSIHVPARAADTLYSQKIAVPADAAESLRASVADAAATLQNMTGQEFVINNEYSGSGIFLLRVDAKHANAAEKKWLADKGREPFVILSSDDKNLWIIANGDVGLQHGLYFYLEQLGVRFYFPTANWTIIPRKQDITLKINRQMAPDFKLRGFFGTGGFGRPANDPTYTVQRAWELWKRRNRFGGEYSLGGHSGEAFNMDKKAILLEHPEYLANVNGKFVPWSPTAKLNTANPDAVKLFVDWTVERFRKMRKADPHAFAVSVDPSDSGGHCNSDECKQIGNGSSSDQVFYIANEAAKAVRAEFPDGWVNLYGYNEHAMPPSFPLQPNVYVQIIPYAFQRTGMTPEEFIQAWGKKVSRMSIYDYWSIPDWTHDMPSFNYLRTPAAKLQFWHDNNIEGFSAESTYSAGAMGIGWYLASRQMWDLKTDPQPILNEFYDQAFGPARAPMQRMLERWATEFLLGDHEMALSYRDLQEALRLAKTPEVRARITDYGRYVEYLRLHQQWQNAPKEEKTVAKSTLVDYIWDIYPTTMIHAFREYELVTRNDKETRALYTGKDAAGWNTVALPTEEEIIQALAAGVEKYPLLDIVKRNYTGVLIPLVKSAASPTGEFSPVFPSNASLTLEMQAAPGISALPLRIETTADIGYTVTDAAGQVVSAREIEQIGQQDIQIPLPQAGRYVITFNNKGNSRLKIQAPAGIPLVIKSFRNHQGLLTPRLYFYVPAGLKTIAMHFPYIDSGIPRFYGPDNTEVTPKLADVGKTILIPVPPGQDGKVWSFARAVHTARLSFKFYNVPPVFSLFADTLMVPEDALEPVRDSGNSN